MWSVNFSQNDAIRQGNNTPRNVHKLISFETAQNWNPVPDEEKNVPSKDLLSVQKIHN